MTSILTFARTSLIAAVIAGFSAFPATAQEFSEEHLELARLAATSSPLAKDLDTVLPLAVQNVQNRLINLRPDLHEVISATVQNVALRLTARRPDLDNAIALVWAREFNDEELRAIADFYMSPAGKKFVAVGPKLGTATVQTVENWASRVYEELLDKSREELKTQGYEF
jgi:uncharacterized protein